MVITLKMTTDLENIQNSYPFLSLIRIGKDELVGIIQNSDTKVLSIYVYEYIPKDLKQKFLDYGDSWWWESNRKIPINIFIGSDFVQFRPYLRTYTSKDTKVVFGPITKLSLLADSKRIRRKTVQLLRTVK